MAIKPVIVGTDGSAASARAVAWAVQEAVRRDVPLRIVAVLPPGFHGSWLVPADPLYGALRETAVHALDEEASRAGLAAPELTVDTSLVIDEPAPFLAGLGLSASMLVVGTRGAARPGMGQLGSVSRYLATHARCPVVIIPSATPAPQRQIVVGVRDPDDEAHLAFAFEEAASRSAHGRRRCHPCPSSSGAGPPVCRGRPPGSRQAPRQPRRRRRAPQPTHPVGA
jgi:nucleotide-binding universal stress UspA family protein